MPKLGMKARMYALPFAIKKAEEEAVYRVYMSDLVLSTAVALTNSPQMPPRYWEIINPKPEETRTADEVIAHIRKKLQEVRER